MFSFDVINGNLFNKRNFFNVFIEITDVEHVLEKFPCHLGPYDELPENIKKRCVKGAYLPIKFPKDETTEKFRFRLHSYLRCMICGQVVPYTLNENDSTIGFNYPLDHYEQHNPGKIP